MSILGGSPLGLIGVKSTPTRDGMSTFNGGKSRNINVNFYNTGREADKERLKKTGSEEGAFSVFTGGSVIRAWGNINSIGKDSPNIVNNYKNIARRSLHNNDVYDTSILNIIERTANTSAALRPSDFAYLKKLGVYPNNRLIIARRFPGPMPDDIFSKGNPPISVMIDWRKEDEDFLDINFGEHWIEAKADFTQVLNEMGKDFGIGGEGAGAGDVLGAGLGGIPLPGFTEKLQRAILIKLGVLSDPDGDILPSGNPNLIKEAKRRKTVPKGEAGSGLKCTVSIKMLVEYEQKFISGLDPTIVFQDILANSVRFGTSPSSNYGVSPEFGKKIINWANNPKSLITDFVNAIKNGLQSAKDDLIAEINKEYDKKINEEEAEAPDPEPPKSEKLTAEKEAAVSAFTGFVDKIINDIGSTLAATVTKYKEEITGIVKALTGAPSTPWHVTIGNPLRPIFCSGDMYTDSVSLKLGPTLAFNDLPSYITTEFTLINARPWGAQEIMSKFNSGYLRSVNLKKDSSSVNSYETINNSNYEEQNKISGTNSNVPINNSSSSVDNQVPGLTQSNQSGTQSTTKENDTQQSINSNPNSGNGPTI